MHQTESTEHAELPSEGGPKFGRVVFEICERTHRQTNRHTEVDIIVRCAYLLLTDTLIVNLRPPTAG